LNQKRFGLLVKTRILATLLLAASATVAFSAFASGYGPAPFYRPNVGAPASQQGQNAQTVAAERANAAVNSSVGGAKAQSSQSGAREQVSGAGSVPSAD